MTKATRETTKLNFITDQGSTRAMVRCACRAVRFDCACCAAVRAAACPSPAAVLPAAVLPAAATEAALRAAWFLPVRPDRRNVRAGDDGEFGGGSGISHANAAGETDGGSAGAGRLPADGRPGGPAPEGEAVPEGELVPEGEAVPKGEALPEREAPPEGTPGPAGAAAGRWSPGGITADSAG